MKDDVEAIHPILLELAFTASVADRDTARAEGQVFQLLRLLERTLEEPDSEQSIVTRLHRLMYECRPFILTTTGGLRILIEGTSPAVPVADHGMPAVRILFEEGALHDQAKQLGFTRGWITFPSGEYRWPWAPSRADVLAAPEGAISLETRQAFLPGAADQTECS